MRVVARRWGYDLVYNETLWLWVPAFAGTTRGVSTMAKQQSVHSRRTFIGAAIAGFPATLLLRTASASDKMTKPQAEYQDTPNGIYSCGLCTLFVAPDGCKVVEGVISKDGWCKAFAAVD
ncbi:hypothetical protein ACVINW_000318 [Bradyrhizobium sp. USDA 4461]